MLAALAAPAILGAAVLLFFRPLEPAPLVNPAGLEVSFPASTDDVLSWGIDVPRNRTDSTIVFVSAEPMEISGLDILGSASFDPDPKRLSIGLLMGYPPEGYSLAAVEGTTVPPRETRHVVFGVQLASGATSGAICGVRITYDHDGRRHELLLDYELHLLPPAETQSPAPSLDSDACPGS